jgi:hypothetical protein
MKDKNSSKKSIFDLNDLSDVPKEIADLILVRNEKTTKNISGCIIELFKEKNILSTSEMAIALYRKHKIIRPRFLLTSLVGPYLKHGIITTNFKGTYTYKAPLDTEE